MYVAHTTKALGVTCTSRSAVMPPAVAATAAWLRPYTSTSSRTGSLTCTDDGGSLTACKQAGDQQQTLR